MTTMIAEQNNVTEDRVGTFIVTYSGVKFYPLDMRPDEILIEDIAHHSSNICRYTGAVDPFYSVAEHAVRASWNADDKYGPEVAFDVLMHDASEAYAADVSRPVKQLPELASYLELEEKIMFAIAGKFEFNWPMTSEVKEMDDGMLLAEWKSLMPLHDELDGPFFDAVREYDGRLITPWTSTEAKAMFLEEFDELQEVLSE